MVKRTDSFHRDCGFESYTCHINNAISEEDKRKPLHKVHFPTTLRALSLVSATLEIEYATQFFLSSSNPLKLHLALTFIFNLLYCDAHRFKYLIFSR